eukprot:TRINITY_DN3556_c0_g2_i1.p1 TRINITY_DN3556_c0_g2~~TRINITY_DN3556_c0_g2_i1.p1  ORF type:complete len:465 (+),score=65.04 TRINITY_DN3556_c0_g2_i1:83-1477(+)
MLRCCAHRRAPNEQPMPNPAVAAPAPAASSSFKDGTKSTEDFKMTCLAEVFSVDFLEKFRTRSPLHVLDVVPQIKNIIKTDSVILAFARASEMGSLAVTKNGAPFIRESLFMAYLDCATLSLVDAELYFPALMSVCQVLAPTFGYAKARMVLEPPKARSTSGVTEEDVFVLQVSGEQRITLLPLDDKHDPLPVTAPRSQPLLACNIRPGDVVFIPSGVECRKDAVNAPTEKDDATTLDPVLSVLITVRMQEHSLQYSLGSYVNTILREALPDTSDALFRSAVTKSTLTDPTSKAGVVSERQKEVEAKLYNAVASFRSKLCSSALRDHFEQRMEKLRQEQLDGAAKIERDSTWDPSQRNVVFSTSSIRVAMGVSCRCAAGDTVAHFKRGSETLSLPIERSASYLISELCDGRPHIVSSLTCHDKVERLCVCQILIQKECLEIADDNDYTGSSIRGETASTYSGGF